METLLYAGTEDGVVVLRWDGGTGLRVVGRGLAGQAVRAIAVDPRNPAQATLGCGLRGWGLHRTADAGGSFEALGFADGWVWEVAHMPGDPEALWVGTEPPMLYVSRDGGATFQPLDGVALNGDTGLAHWRTTLVRKADGARIRLDGVLTATFDSSGRCRHFREWWHRQEG